MMESDNNNYVKVLFRFYSSIFEKEMVETLWAESIDKAKGYYKIDSIPFYASQVACGDIVFAEYDDNEQILTYRKTIEHSGSSTVQVVLLDKSVEINAVRNLFIELGGLTEKLNQSYFVMEIPRKADHKKIWEKLDTMEKEEVISYAVPCLAEGHRS